MTLQIEIKNFTSLESLTTINCMSHSLFVAGLTARNIFPELKELLLQRVLACCMRGIFNEKVWTMCKFGLLITRFIVAEEQRRKAAFEFKLKK